MAINIGMAKPCGWLAHQSAQELKAAKPSMRLTGYPTSCLTLAVTLVKTTRQQRETLPIAGFALDADKWSGTGSI